MRPVIVALLSLAWLAGPGAASAGSIEVFPGPGTPLQDAIDAAPERTVLRLHGGTYAEAVIVTKPLGFKVYGDGDVTIDAGCDVPVVFDLAGAEGVSFMAKDVFGKHLWIRGGSAHTLRIGGSRKIRVRGVGVYSYECSDAIALTIDDSTEVSMQDVHADGRRGAIRLTNIPLRPAIKLKDVSAVMSLDPIPDAVTVRLTNVSPGATLGRGGVMFINSHFNITGSVGGPGVTLRLENAHGIRFTKGSLRSEADPAVVLDAQSSNNLFLGARVISSAASRVIDDGTGNCGRAILPVNHFAPCP